MSPAVSHHVTQRGNGRQRTFFGDALYRDLLAEHARAAGVAVWSWVGNKCTVTVICHAQVDDDVAGNVVARTGTYVRTDGTSRATASVQFALQGKRISLYHAKEKRMCLHSDARLAA